jgi:hypothetical protein
MNYHTLLLALFGFVTIGNAQENKIQTTWDGAVIAGYVNEGAFINFGGPSLKLIRKPYTVSLGLLPTLRIKEDKVAPGQKKNSTITPTLGSGITFGYKHLALQLPLYYNPKNTATDGKWNLGIGIGYKL